MSIRTEKVASQIKHQVAEILSREFTYDKVGLLTVTNVIISPDLKIAKVFISVLGDETKKENAIEILETNKKHIRKILASKLPLKFIPLIDFFVDETTDKIIHMEEIFKKIHNDDND